MIGLIYKVRPYQETNRMLFVYTPEGKKTLIAKGSQRLASELRIISQYLTEIEFYDNTKGIQPLREAKLLNDFENIKKDYLKTKLVASMLEGIDKIDDDNLDHLGLYEELIAAIKAPNLEEASLSFLIKLIAEAGFRPNLEADGRPVIGFNLEKASIIYKDDLTKIDLSVKHLIILLKLLNLPISKLEVLTIEDFQIMKQFIKKYYEHHIHVSLKNI